METIQPKVKWYEALQGCAKKWLLENTDNSMFDWQTVDRHIVVECYAIKPKGKDGTDLKIITFVYYRNSKTIMMFEQTPNFLANVG